MLNANAKKWVEALRSGRFKQGKNALHKKREGEDDTYCCLGVACSLAIGAGVDLPVYTNMDGKVIYDVDKFYLPAKVRDWLGLTTSYASFGIALPGANPDDLTRMNDDGKTFEEIAQIIESEPAGLFK